MKYCLGICLLLFSAILVYFCSSSFLMVHLFSYSCLNSFFCNFSSHFVYDSTSSVFCVMVLLVTSLVLVYSQFYMEGYNTFKFVFLTLIFFFFMIVLIFSEDLMSFMIGWDGLGVSSLFLIMFYPNKISLFNSYLTLSFNRLGDLFLVLFFCVSYSSSSIVYSILLDPSLASLLILFFCLLTKSAQLPFSSWLPAAMSAPTPISAMVHSSTLVTAGILIFFKTLWYFSFFSLMSLLLLISSCTFLVGGFLGTSEKDLKKIVAFSTMSQISMVLVFLSFYYPYLAISHTFCHALFKTLLFCSCGVFFAWGFSDQSLKSFFGVKDHGQVYFLIFISIFSMSGLAYSSSFFTKDSVLEALLTGQELFLFLILLTGSVFTLIYSSVVLESCNLMKKPSFQSSTKNFQFSYISFFTLCLLFLFSFFKESLKNNFCFFIPNSMLFLIGLTLLLTMVYSKINNNKIGLNSSSSVFHLKDITFTSVKMAQDLEFWSSDLFIFKPSNLVKEMNMKKESYWEVEMLIFPLLIFILLVI